MDDAPSRNLQEQLGRVEKESLQTRRRIALLMLSVSTAVAVISWLCSVAPIDIVRLVLFVMAIAFLELYIAIASLVFELCIGQRPLYILGIAIGLATKLIIRHLLDSGKAQMWRSILSTRPTPTSTTNSSDTL